LPQGQAGWVMVRCNVLVVENEDALREEVTEFLEESGYRVDSVADGPAALDYLRQHAPDNLPDVILLDFWMPRMNGREVKAELRKDPALSRIAVVAFTANRLSDEVLSIGADDYLAKPPDPDQLLSTVEYFCKSRKQQSASGAG
jgi:CheY-like chemotaxis protein